MSGQNGCLRWLLGKGVGEEEEEESSSLTRLPRVLGQVTETVACLRPAACLNRCYYFDGPSYSVSPDMSVPLEQRWITFFINLRTPLDGSEKAWSAM